MMELNTTLETTWTIMPSDTNYMSPLVFGGAFFSHLDLCAAQTVSRFLYPSDCAAAVTHKASVTFMKPCYCGDIVFLRGEITGTGKKSISCRVTAQRERRYLQLLAHQDPEWRASKDLVASADFVFVAVQSVESVHKKPDLLPYGYHGLTFPSADKT